MEKNFDLKFIDDKGTFVLKNADKYKRLYFPLMNETGFISSITPDLKGDIKTGQHSFLNPPVSVEDLYLTQSSRNFWAVINDKNIWSASGVSKEADLDSAVTLEAGLLYHKITRINNRYKIQSDIINFVPSTGEHVEIMLVSLKNLSKKEQIIQPYFGMPLFCRSAENLRDHRNVTSMLNRTKLTKESIIVTPTMLFNESGHQPNENIYFVTGLTGSGKTPTGFYPTVLDWAGETGDFERPDALFNKKQPVKNFEQGVEAVAGIKFSKVKLKPNQSSDFIIIMGITKNQKKIRTWQNRFNTKQKCQKSLKQTNKFWLDYTDQIKFQTADKIFNNWIKWVSVQPLFRKIAGNSFLPDFDYGKGGRGWRDLWQDLLAIILVNPDLAKNSLLNNFAGIRIDGSNATVIGTKPGEFIADRNNVTRVWMDHGVWPFYTVNLYLNSSNDYNFLFKKVKYFKDFQIKRAKEKDWTWKQEDGKTQKTKSNIEYKGTILEHILLQNIIQFYNVGKYNNILLEDADWNDGLDMAHHKGESVAFSAFYAGNLETIAGILSYLKKKKKILKIEVFEEMKILLDTLGKPIFYDSVKAKREILEKYLEKTKHRISGKTVKIDIDKLIKDLRKKAEWIRKHILNKEIINTKNKLTYFNGYYDDHAKRVEGSINNTLRMTLTGQVFPLMFGIGDSKTIHDVWESAKKILWDKNLNGLRLNSDFKEVKLDLGRAFGFAFGHKENGSFFSHMNVMFGNALYKRDHAKEGYTILNSIYGMWSRLNQSKIYPGIPEYFNNKGRGYYHYLTGSASWYILTILTEVFGIKGKYGDLLLAPKLLKKQFNKDYEALCYTSFANKKLLIVFKNKKNLEFNQYRIEKVILNNKEITIEQNRDNEAILKRNDLIMNADRIMNKIEVILI